MIRFRQLADGRVGRLHRNVEAARDGRIEDGSSSRRFLRRRFVHGRLGRRHSVGAFDGPTALPERGLRESRPYCTSNANDAPAARPL